MEFPDLLEKALNGDPKDYKNLAYKYFEKNTRSLLAFEWFLRAAQEGDAESQFMIGSMYNRGFSWKPKNPDKAAKWLLAAYNQGFWESLVDLGMMLEDGYVFEKDAFDLNLPEYCYAKALNSEPIRQTFLKEAQERLDRLRVKNKPLVFQLRNTQSSTPPDIALDDLIGLKTVKNQMRQIENRIIFDQKRLQAGLHTLPQSHHFVFKGNPGTGKTEVARIMGRIFKKLGILTSGHVVEVDRSDLVGEYIGETAQKTKTMIDKSLNGVLFIDEAHSLFTNSKKDYGSESINVILKAMEDYKDRLVVIMAGYEDHMNILLRSSPGLKSRIRHHLLFSDYTAEELTDIYSKFVHDNGFVLHGNSGNVVSKLMHKAVKLTDSDLGNARFARNAFEKTVEKMAVRIVQNNIDDQTGLQTIMFMDIPTIAELTGQKQPAHSTKDNVVNIHDD